MVVRFLTNLGSLDAESVTRACGCEVDHKACVCGAEVELADAAAALLVDRGIAVALPPVIKAVPPAPIQAIPPAEEGTVERATADLEAYKAKHTKRKK